MVPAPPPHLGSSDEDFPRYQGIETSQAFAQPLSTNGSSADTACRPQIPNDVAGIDSESANHRPVRATRRGIQYRARRKSDEYDTDDDIDEGEESLGDTHSVARAWIGGSLGRPQFETYKRHRGRPRTVPYGPHLPKPTRKRGRPRKEEKLAMASAHAALDAQ
jgi:hypothetical protein